VRLVHLAVAAALPCALLVAVAGASRAAPTTHASALAVRVTVPGQSGATAGAVAAPPAASTPGSPFAYPVDGTVVSVQSASSSVAAQAGTSASAQGIADVLGVSLFAGEITAESVSVRATVAAGAANASAPP
jgi:hypothetical protein